MQLSSVYWTTNLGNPRTNHKLTEYTFLTIGKIRKWRSSELTSTYLDESMGP